MAEELSPIGVAREVAHDLRRWRRAFGGLTAYAVDMRHAAERLDAAIEREEARSRTAREGGE